MNFGETLGLSSRTVSNSTKDKPQTCIFLASLSGSAASFSMINGFTFARRGISRSRRKWGISMLRLRSLWLLKLTRMTVLIKIWANHQISRKSRNLSFKRWDRMEKSARIWLKIKKNKKRKCNRKQKRCSKKRVSQKRTKWLKLSSMKIYKTPKNHQRDHILMMNSTMKLHKMLKWNWSKMRPFLTIVAARRNQSNLKIW